MYGLHEAKRLLRYSTIRAGLDLIYASHISKLLPSATKNGLIFTLHHVRPAHNEQTFSPNAILAVTPEFLEATIQTVLKAGMMPVHVHDLPELLRNNPQQHRYVCFTLDDGYRNNATYAAPIFRRYNIPYTIYVTSGFVERKNILWWEVVEATLRKIDKLSFDFGQGRETRMVKTTLQKMSAFAKFARFVDETNEDRAVEHIGIWAQNHGIDPQQLTRDLIMDVFELCALAQEAGKTGLMHLGAHTVSHINLSRVGETRILEEIKQSAEWLTNIISIAPKSFAYPYGWATAVSERTCLAAYKAGFPTAVTTQAGMLASNCLQQPHAFPRVSLNGYFQKQRYVKTLISGVPFIRS